MESLGEEREGILLSEVEVGIARQHIATAVEKRRCNFVTRCQLLTDRLLADLLRYDGRVVELMPAGIASPKSVACDSPSADACPPS